MVRIPELLFVVDIRREDTAIHEANLLEIPVVAMVDTNCDPGNIDFVIPSNDDAIRAIKLIVGKVADAVLEGKAMRKDVEEEMPDRFADFGDEELNDADLLGAATLAKLQSQREEEDDDDDFEIDIDEVEEDEEDNIDSEESEEDEE